MQQGPARDWRFVRAKESAPDALSYPLRTQLRLAILLEDPSVEGFNIGANVGLVSGQTIFHCHIHLIPRRKGDVEDPLGGVRAVIAGMQRY